MPYLLQRQRRPPYLPDKPSIAVLPFANMSGDPEQEYFADGMVEEIITALSSYNYFGGNSVAPPGTTPYSRHLPLPKPALEPPPKGRP